MADEKLERFGKHIREIRLQNNMTQEALAEASALHPTYIGGIERGERNLSLANILKLADALGVRPSALLSVFDQEGREA